ncbi:MAG: hypothetical protein ACE5KA_08020 [Nitrososphaerales archaeon]
MNSKPLIISTIAVGVAIGYIGGFLTFYNELSDVETVNASAVRDELDSLKADLTKANTRVSLLMEDNESLRSSLSQMRTDNETLQNRIDALQVSLGDPNSSLSKIEKGVMLIHMVSGPMPFEGEELSVWRVSVANETAKLDPSLVPDMLKLVDSWVDIVQFEEGEPDDNTPEWDQWNLEWQNKALVFIDAHNSFISKVTDAVTREIDSVKSLI